MFSKIDFRDILRDHFSTLTSGEQDTLSAEDLVLFFGLPLGAAIVLPLLNVCVSKEAASLLINALAIFAGLLLNLLVLIHSLIRRYLDPVKHRTARALLHGLYANMSYAILVAILTLIPLVVIGFVKTQRTVTILSAVIFFALANFLLTLLMILKRVHALLSREFKNPQKDS
jgi:hypothetical protein